MFAYFVYALLDFPAQKFPAKSEKNGTYFAECTFYINDKSCNIPENKIKIKISHILDTAPSHTTEYDFKKGFHCKI